MAEGRDIGLNYTMSNGEYNVPCRIYKPILVTKENIDETVIKDGFFTAEQVYRHVP